MQARLTFNLLTVFILIVSVMMVAYKYLIGTSDHTIWILPVLSILVYVLLTYLIKHPALLIKKTRLQLENPETYPVDEALSWWKKFYYLFRFAIAVMILVVIYFVCFF